MRLALVLPALLFAAVLVPTVSSAATGQRCVAPPGTGAVDQYCELVPAAGGDRVAGAGTSRPRLLEPATARALREAGTDGRGLQALALTGTAPVRERGSERPPRVPQVTTVSLSAPSSNPLTALSSAVSDGSTASGVLPWFLLALALGFGGAAWVRGRRS